MRIDNQFKKKLQVALQMSRDSRGEWHLTIEDRTSSLIIAEIKMNDKEFSNLMANTNTTGKAEYYANPNVGKELENLTFKVPLEELEGIFTSYSEADQKRDMKHLYDYAEEKNPGWIASRDRFSSHCRNYKDFTYSVNLRRYVEKK